MKNGIISFFMLCILYSAALASAVSSDTTLNAKRLGAITENIDPAGFSTVFYVSVEKGNDKKDHGTKEKPWRTIVYALSQIKTENASSQRAMFVAAGVYKQGTVIMKEGLDMYGGFESKNWGRDIYEHATILDGQQVRRVVVAADHTVLDGFTVCNGVSGEHGAGILCADVSPRISNNFIINNLVLEPKDFDPSHIHQEGNNGGGIACLYNAVPVIRNNIFYDNKTSVGTGAAISFYGWVRHKQAPDLQVRDNRLRGGWRGRVENNVIINNTAGLNDLKRTRSSSGGGIACAYEARPLIQNNLVALNRAMGRSDAGGIYCEYFSGPTINGNWVLGNISDDDGGGFYTMKLGMPLLSNNFFAGNYTTGGGVGAIRISKEGRARIVDNIVVYNPGGGVMCVDSYIELEDNIIMNNSAGSGFRYVQNYTYFKPPVIRNNIMQGNEEGEVTVSQNVADKLQVEQDSDAAVPAAGDAIRGKITAVTFDPVHYVTRLALDKEPKISKNLVGRVIKAGEQWTIIKKVTGREIILWGEISVQAKDFEIIASFVD